MKPALFLLSRLVLCFAFLLTLGRVQADPPAAPNPAPARPVSLAEALATMPAASVADGTAVMTVQSDWINPVPPAPPAAGDTPVPETSVVQTPDTLAARYGRSLQVFGMVVALAPPTMTVLNIDPALADVPLPQLAAQHPMPFLLGTLTQAQIQQMSTTGLGFSDLSPDQQALLQAALPTPFQIVPVSVKQPSYSEDDIKKTGEERAEIDARVAEESRLYTLNTQTIPPDKLLSSLRLYGFLAPNFTFDDEGIGVGDSDDPLATTGPDTLVNGGRTDMGMPFSQPNPLQALLRTEQPNTPKESDLDWNRDALAKPVSLPGVRTVGELTAKLAKATGLELYVDSHYAGNFVQMRGDLKASQPAGNVMQALAVCVCGTWRQVGPAYVLTDDVMGLGTRREFLREMVQAWSNRLTEAGKAVGGHLGEMDWLHALRFEPGDLGKLSTAQVDDIQKQNGTNSGNLHWKDLPGPLREGLYGQLTRHYGSDGMDNFEAAANKAAKSLKPDSSVGVSLALRLGVGLPDTGIMTLGDPYRVQMPSPTPPPAAAPEPPKAQQNSVVLDKPLRGVLCAPKTPDEARAVVALLPKMGMNTLFLDVFTNGRTYFPNHSFPPADAQAGGVLQAALDAAHAAHIPVYAVLDLLCWRKDGASVHSKPWPAHFTEDLTVGGEAPDHSVQRQFDAGTIRSDLDRDYEMVQNGNQGWASPLDPRVSAVLPSLVQDLAAVKGLAGIVFQDTAPPGYLGLAYDNDMEGISLGYTPDNRLAYLRTFHSDPVDVTNFDSLSLYLPFEGFQTSFDVSIAAMQASGLGSDTSAQWNTVRGDADKSLLASCYAAARRTAPTLPLLMRERQIGATFDPWTDPKKLNQYATLDSLALPFRQITPASILSLAYGPVEKAHPDRFVWETQGYGMVGDDGKRAGGEVFDLVTGGAPENLPDTLDKLNVFLKKP